MISQPGALESPQSLMAQNLQWTFEIYVNRLNHCVETFSPAMGERMQTHHVCVLTEDHQVGCRACGYEEGDQEELQTKMNAFPNEELILQTYLTQTLYCSDSALLGEIASLFLLLWISNHSISGSGSNALFSAAIKPS